MALYIGLNVNLILLDGIAESEPAYRIRLGPDPLQKGRFEGRNPQFAAIPPITKLLTYLLFYY